jgi:uncharacterized protein
MTAQAWRDSVVAYIRDEARPVDKFGHQPRLYALAVRLGQGMEYDDETLFAAAWMHDLGVFIGHRPQDPAHLGSWDHVPYTIARTKELLTGWGFPAEKLEAVAEAIRTHQPQDILEQLGAIGAMRALVKVGRDTRYATFSDVLAVLRAAVDGLPERLRLRSAQLLAKERVIVLRVLIAAIEEEAGDLLF